jgi:hypothetical protein
MTLSNDEYEIEVRRKTGRVYYSYAKIDGRWRQTVVNDKVYEATTEQVLNHLLPVPCSPG